MRPTMSRSARLRPLVSIISSAFYDLHKKLSSSCCVNVIKLFETVSGSDARTRAIM